jgi:hypothetical protein
VFSEATLTFHNIILITGKASDITADIEILIMMFVLVKSQIRNLWSIIKFIESFSTSDIQSSALGQTLTLILSVSQLIEKMGPNVFVLPHEDYEKMCNQMTTHD